MVARTLRVMSAVILVWVFAASSSSAAPLAQVDEMTPTAPPPVTVQAIDAGCLSGTSVAGIITIANPDGATAIGLSLQYPYHFSQHVTLWLGVANSTVEADSGTE
ncbi:MAG TPA: hypothetical protein VFQ54_09790, partial [Thermomicrobiales bacterium]|nr:hypothetical protein [Thermomicrobiales bacterium]